MYKEEIAAPIKKGTAIGTITYSLNGKEIGNVDIVATEDVEKSGFSHFFEKLLQAFWL